jgi:hypothetical protein
MTFWDDVGVGDDIDERLVVDVIDGARRARFAAVEVVDTVGVVVESIRLLIRAISSIIILRELITSGDAVTPVDGCVLVGCGTLVDSVVDVGVGSVATTGNGCGCGSGCGADADGIMIGAPVSGCDRADVPAAFAGDCIE